MNDDGAGQSETHVNDYNLVIDRQMRVIRPLDRYVHADMVYFALTAVSDLDYSKPNSRKEMLRSKDKQHRLRAMDEEWNLMRRIRLGNWSIDQKIRR